MGEKHLNWGIMQERNIYCTHSKFSLHSDTRDHFLPLKKTQMEALRLLLTPTEKLPQPQKQLQAHDPKLFPEHSGLYRVGAQHKLLSPAFPVLPCQLTGSMEVGGLQSQGRVGMERSLAKQSCHSSCNRRTCQTCCKLCQEPNQPSGVAQQKPGGFHHLLSGVSAGHG